MPRSPNTQSKTRAIRRRLTVRDHATRTLQCLCAIAIAACVTVAAPLTPVPEMVTGASAQGGPQRPVAVRRVILRAEVSGNLPTIAIIYTDNNSNGLLDLGEQTDVSGNTLGTPLNEVYDDLRGIPGVPGVSNQGGEQGPAFLGTASWLLEVAGASRNARDARTGGGSTSITVEGGIPKAVISGVPQDAQAGTPFTIAVRFADRDLNTRNIPVTAFTADDIEVINGEVVGQPLQQGGDASTYTVTITPTAARTPVMVQVRANRVSDASDLNGSNVSVASEQISVPVVADTTPPTVRYGGSEFITNTNVFTIRITFSEVVTGLQESEIQVTNGSLVSGSLAGSGAEYTIAITPTGAGPVSIQVQAGAAQDAAGNGNTASRPFTLADRVRPTVEITGRPTSVANTNPFDVTISFSEAVTGFDAATDITVENGRAAAPVRGVDATTYTVQITPTGAGPVRIRVPANVAQDLAGNPNTASDPVTVADEVRPAVEITGQPRSVSNTEPFTVNITFSEPVNGLDLTDDLIVTNGAAVAPQLQVQGSGLIGTTVRIIPTGAGDVTILIPANVAQDAAGNGNTASNQVTVADAVRPAAVISEAPQTVRGGTPFEVTVTFSEPVSGFNAVADIDVDNGQAAAPVPQGSDGTVYTVEVTPTGAGAGAIGIQVPAGAAQDDANNGNEASNRVEVEFIPTGNVVLAVNAADAGTVRFVSQTQALNVSVPVAAAGGIAASGEIVVEAGAHVVSYQLPTGFSVTAASCSPAGSSVDRRAKRLSLDIQPNATVRCTLAVQDTATRTARQVRDFMEDRARLIQSNRPGRDRRIARLNRAPAPSAPRGAKHALSSDRLSSHTPSHQDHSDHALSFGSLSSHTRSSDSLPGYLSSFQNHVNQTLPVGIALGSRQGGEKVQLRGSCSQLRRAKTGTPAGCRNDVWFEGNFGRYTSRDDDAKGHYSVVHGGLDRRLGEGLLIGIGAQYDHVVRRGRADKQSADIRGNGVMVGPYVTARLHENLYFDGGIKAGTSENEITMPGAGFTDSFSTWRWGAHGTLLGDFDLGRFNIRPQTGFAWYEETAKSWKDSNGIAIPEVATSMGDLEVGVRVAHTMADGVSSQYVEVDGVFTLAGTGEKEERLRLGTGFTMAIPFGGMLEAGVSFDGLGDGDWQSYGVKLGYSVLPRWLSGAVINTGLKFDGVGADQFDMGAISLGLRSAPGTWFGGAFETGVSFDGWDGDKRDLSGRVGYNVKW